MKFSTSFTIVSLIFCLLMVSKTTSQNVASPFQSSGLKRELSTNQNKPTRLGKIVNLFRKTISKLRPARKGKQRDPSRKIVRKALNELPFHATSNEIDAQVHQLIPPHEVDRKSLEDLNSYESEVLSNDDTILDKLSSYAILSHSEPSFAKVVLSNPHYNRATTPGSSVKNVLATSKVNSGQPIQKNFANNGMTVQNVFSASSNFVSGVRPVPKTVNSETEIRHVPVNFRNSYNGDSSVPTNGILPEPGAVTSGSAIHQVNYIPSPFQLGVSSRDYSVTPLDSNSVSSNYQGTILPMLPEGFLYQESSPMISGSSYQSTEPIKGNSVYQMSTPVIQSGTIYHMPSYQVSQATSEKPISSHVQNQYGQYRPIAHPPSKTSGQFYKPVYTISKNLFGKPLKPNTFVKQNMNKLMQTIYPYYHKPKFRYPYYDKEGNGKLLYGFGTPKLYEYNVFRPLGGYMKR